VPRSCRSPSSGSPASNPATCCRPWPTHPRWPRRVYGDETGVWSLVICVRTRSGRPLKVAVRPHDGRDWQIIAVRELAPAELAEFKAWEEGR
jgi:hypothetical protein